MLAIYLMNRVSEYSLNIYYLKIYVIVYILMPVNAREPFREIVILKLI